MARRRSFHGVGRPAKKLAYTRWDLSTGSSIAQSAGTVGINFSTIGTEPVTLLRMRGELSAYREGASGTAILVQVTYGIILVPEGTGSTVLFDPVLDGNAPWLLYGQGAVGYEEMVVDVVDVAQLTMFRHTIDNKAMRIIRPDIEMQMVVSNTTISGAADINFSYGLRWLIGF